MTLLVLAALPHGYDRIIDSTCTDRRNSVGGVVADENLLGQRVDCISTSNLMAS